MPLRKVISVGHLLTLFLLVDLIFALPLCDVAVGFATRWKCEGEQINRASSITKVHRESQDFPLFTEQPALTLL